MELFVLYLLFQATIIVKAMAIIGIISVIVIGVISGIYTEGNLNRKSYKRCVIILSFLSFTTLSGAVLIPTSENMMKIVGTYYVVSNDKIQNIANGGLKFLNNEIEMMIKEQKSKLEGAE